MDLLKKLDSFIEYNEDSRDVLVWIQTYTENI